MTAISRYRDDLLAGLTRAVAGAPQAMGFALIAGVSPVYGLYAAFVSTIVGTLASDSTFMTIAPTNALALVVFSTLENDGNVSIEKMAVLSAGRCLPGRARRAALTDAFAAALPTFGPIEITNPYTRGTPSLVCRHRKWDTSEGMRRDTFRTQRGRRAWVPHQLRLTHTSKRLSSQIIADVTSVRAGSSVAFRRLPCRLASFEVRTGPVQISSPVVQETQRDLTKFCFTTRQQVDMVTIWDNPQP